MARLGADPLPLGSGRRRRADTADDTAVIVSLELFPQEAQRCRVLLAAHLGAGAHVVAGQRSGKVRRHRLRYTQNV
jgi:hypothetical protein